MKTKVKSYAKVNLGLCLHGKRNDGFHQLETIMHEIDLHDDLYVSESNESFDSLTVEGCDELDNKDNLILKSLTLLREVYPKLPFFETKLVKRIPIGGGLGGGSSNAIATLLHASKSIGSIDSEQIETIASRLGSDTNFFINGGTAICRGRGEQVSDLKPREFFFNLILPNVHCSTIEVFKKCTPENYHRRELQVLWESPQYLAKNDLEMACNKAYPEMHAIIDDFKSINQSIFLSGSGSTLYTIDSDENLRNQKFEKLEQQCALKKIKLIKTRSFFRA